MKLKIPNSIEDSESLINEVRELISSKKDDDSYEEIIWASCKDMINLAGSYNHNITSSQREEMIKVLSDNPDQSLDPVLQALVDCPRADQFDLTKKYIRKLRNK